MYAVIQYLDVVGYEDDCTEIYGMVDYECATESEYNYYMHVLDQDDIFDVKFF